MERTIVTVKELARMIRERNIPKNVKVVDGTITLSEGAPVKDKEDNR